LISFPLRFDSSFSLFNRAISTEPAASSVSSSNYVVRTQSTRYHDDESEFDPDELRKLLGRDLTGRTTEVGDGFAACQWPDDAFGFAINEQFVRNFIGSFLSPGALLDKANFRTDAETVDTIPKSNDHNNRSFP
jgi:hypothetical protein